MEALDEPKPIILRDVPFDAFDIFSRWVYDGKLELEDAPEGLKDEAELDSDEDWGTYGAGDSDLDEEGRQTLAIPQTTQI